MRRKRYLIVDHPSEYDKVEPGQQVPGLIIHEFLQDYYWSRLDDKTVIVTASYPTRHHDEICNHPKVTVLPSETSNKPVLMHLRNVAPDHHLMAISSHTMDVAEHHTMSELVETLEQTFGAVFASDK